MAFLSVTYQNAEKRVLVCKNGSKFGLESEKTACLVCNSSADFGFGSFTPCGVQDDASVYFLSSDTIVSRCGVPGNKSSGCTSLTR